MGDREPVPAAWEATGGVHYASPGHRLLLDTLPGYTGDMIERTARGYEQGRVKPDLENRLKRIEGQVRGVQKMLHEGRYCVDVLTQIDAITSALARVQDQILEAHLNHCVADALEGDDRAERRAKVDEVVGLLKRFRRTP